MKKENKGQEENPVISADRPVLPTDGAATPDISQLTAKNSDYIHAITRQLMLAGKSDDEVKKTLGEILPRILEAQKDGTTARALLGTPTDFVSQYKETPKAKGNQNTNTNPWLMWLDSALLIFSVFALVSGAMVFVQKEQMTYGLATLFFSAIFGGIALYIVYKTNYAPQDPNAKAHFRGYKTLSMMVSFLIWFAITFSSLALPTAINPQIGGPNLLIAAVAVFVLRYWIKSKFHIQSAMPTRVQAQQQSKK
jgi:uncharacterized membrane-anchored protein